MFKSKKIKLSELESKELELKSLELSIKNQMKELEETIKVAKEYLNLCGYSEQEIERLRIKNRLKVIECNKKIRR